MTYVFTVLAALSAGILYWGNSSSAMALSLGQSYLVAAVFAVCAVGAVCNAISAYSKGN